jgi:multidrug resistance efflux pump
MDLSIDADGILEPSLIKHIHTHESGIIKEFFVQGGDTVNADDKLLTLNSLQLERSLAEVQFDIKQITNALMKEKEQIDFDDKQNELQLKKAEAQFTKAKAAFRDKLLNFFPKANVDSLYENYKPGSHINLDYAMAEIQSAESDIASRKLSLQMKELKKYDLHDLEIKLSKLLFQEKTLQEKLKHVVIKSPVSGVVLSDGLNELIGTRVGEGDLIMDIGETKNWEVVLFVSERDIHQIKPGNEVKVEISALQSTEDFELYEASVISVAEEMVLPNSNKYSNFAGLYRVTAKLNGEHQNNLDLSKLRYGYKVNGNIITDSGKIFDLLLKYFKDFLS